VDPPYPVFGGLFQQEAIMLLRRFYIQENENGMLFFLQGASNKSMVGERLAHS
jgi:hypothetical protein